MSTVDQFHLWAIEQDLVRANPIRRRAAAVWSPWLAVGYRRRRRLR